MRKTAVLEPLFNKVAGLQLSCEYCKVFKNRFFHKAPPVAASEKFINFPGKHQWIDISHFYITWEISE